MDKHMSIEKVVKILVSNNIPLNTKIMSDSGWECDPTEMNGIYYNENEKLIIFTQDTTYSKYKRMKGWRCLNGD